MKKFRMKLKACHIFLLHLLCVPSLAVLKNTKYRLSNLTRTLILASSPFTDIREAVSVEYGSPSDKGPKIVSESGDDSSAKESDLHEVRVLPPFLEENVSGRHGKSLHPRNNPQK